MTQKLLSPFIRLRGWKLKFFLGLSFCAFLSPALVEFRRYNGELLAFILLPFIIFAPCLKFIPERLLTFPGDWNWRRTLLVIAFITTYVFNTVYHRPMFFLGAICAVPFYVKTMQIVSACLRFLERLCAENPQKANLPLIRRGFFFLVFEIIFLQYLQIQSSVIIVPRAFFFTPLHIFFLNLLITLTLNLPLVLLTQRWTTALKISCFLFTVFSVANYHTLAYHGNMLFFSTLQSALTALDVISGYRLIVNSYLLQVLMLVPIEMRLLRTLGVMERALDGDGKHRVWKFLVRSAAFVLDCAFLAFVALVLFPNSLAPGFVSTAVRKYGFMLATLDDYKRVLRPYSVPEGYDAEKLDFTFTLSLPPKQESSDEKTVVPDIILILNETFCDLGEYVSLPTDRDYLEQFYNIENAIYGHAVTPNPGGGTNSTEFELLTSFSMSLLSDAPFNYAPLHELNCNFVRYLNSLDYVSVGMHCRSASNYNRQSAYPALGFDNVILGPEFFTTRKYGNRECLDADNYQDLIEAYNAMDDTSPRFAYMLTYQNHGGYVQNGPSYDTVHALSDFGDLADELNEYLTSVSMSADAIHELTDYFASVDRPVILCMTGDHAPNFISSLPNSAKRRQWSEKIAQRTVPYLLWSNFDADFSQCPEFTNIFGLSAEIIRSARLPLTPFYRALLDMKQSFPVYMRDGTCMDANGKIGTYDPTDERFAPITRYLYMEYNALQGGDEYKEILFTLPASVAES